MFQLQRDGSHGSIIPLIKTVKRLMATMRRVSWPRGFVIITEVRGMGEHLLRAKQMHFRRKGIRIKGTVHKKKRSIKREWGF